MAIIREARPDDAAPIQRMVFDVLQEFAVAADPEGDDSDVMEFGRSATSGVVHLVAETAVGPIGSAILTPSANDRVKLSKLFVRQDHRRLKIGKLLLEATVRIAKDRGYREIYLRTRERYAAAVRLYETSGWQRGPDQPPPGPDRLYFLTLR